MSFLYPLFLAGIAAIAVPILAHMVRSRTDKRVSFSSLMFVPVSMPRFRNRRRIENVLLLILRCAALCLLAIAFSRPFFAAAIDTNQENPVKRIVVLIDTSASMRRADLWRRALGEVQSVLKNAGGADRLCVMSFDRIVRTVIGFEQWQKLEEDQRSVVTAEQLSQLSPGWGSTNLGHALVAAAEAIEDDEVNEAGKNLPPISRVVLVSDIQQGSSLETLQAYEWPKQIELVVKAVRCKGDTNAAMQLIADGNSLPDDNKEFRPNLRIANSPDATKERFQLKWADESSSGEAAQAVDVYVPAGHSVVAKGPARSDGVAMYKLVLTGDDHDFDNSIFLTPSVESQVNIIYMGNDEPNDPKGMHFYVRKAFGATETLKPNVIAYQNNEVITDSNIEAADMIIVADTTDENVPALLKYIQSGGSLLVVANSYKTSNLVSRLANVENLQLREAEIDQYAMLGQIDFTHPLMTPFSDPRFGDFTRIHFWKYQQIDISNISNVHVLARYDNNDPAWLEIPVGEESLLVFTCGWNPSDSDLALSSKFVPLLYSILEYSGGSIERKSQFCIGDSVPLPHRSSFSSTRLQIRKPDNSIVTIESDEEIFSQTDMPGIYVIEPVGKRSNGNDISSKESGNQYFAVNLSDNESRTTPMSIENLESLGVSLERSINPGIAKPERIQSHGKFVEIESKQKIWRWILIVALIVLLVETWLAGLLTRPTTVSQEMGT